MTAEVVAEAVADETEGNIYLNEYHAGRNLNPGLLSLCMKIAIFANHQENIITTDMKIKNIIYAAAVVAIAAACSGKPAETTKVNVKFTDKVPETITVKSGDTENEIPVTGNTVSFEVPTSPATLATVVCKDLGRFTFVPDGTVLTAEVEAESREDFEVEIESDKKGASVNEKLNAYREWEKDFMEDYREKIEEFRNLEISEEDKTAKIEEFAEKAQKKYNEFIEKSIKSNPDNFIAVDALRKIYFDYSDSELGSLIGSLGENVKSTDFVKNLTEAIESRSKTSEGAKFTDFTVEQSYETKDGDKVELPTVKFSDYVGAGKYILVDFWASWCGPCRMEMPYIAAAYEKYHGDNFDVLSVAVWDKPEDSVKAAPELGIVWKQIINAQHIPTDIYGIQGIPHLILFGPDGTILKRGLRGEGIQEELAKYLD